MENKSIAAFSADWVHPLCVLPPRFGVLTGTSKPPLRLEVASYMRFLIRFCCSDSRLERPVHVCVCVSACGRASGWYVMLLYFLPTLVMWSCKGGIRGFKRPHQSCSYFTAVRRNELGLLSGRHMLMISSFTSWFMDPHGQRMNNTLQVS